MKIVNPVDLALPLAATKVVGESISNLKFENSKGQRAHLEVL
jgi:hypothetical protein